MGRGRGGEWVAGEGFCSRCSREDGRVFGTFLELRTLGTVSYMAASEGSSALALRGLHTRAVERSVLRR